MAARDEDFRSREIAQDIVELNELLTVVKSPRLKTLFENELNRMNELQKQANAEQEPAVEIQQQQQILKSEPSFQNSKKWTPISQFGWDQGDYGSKFVHVYVSGLDGVSKLDKEKIACRFEKDSFDLQIVDLNGKNLRLFKDNLEKEIVPGKCKIKVKGDRVTITLRKQDGKFGPDHWSSLTAKRKKPSANNDPTAGIMDLMKDLYDNGDDDMKRTIGEAMLKSRMGGPDNDNTKI